MKYVIGGLLPPCIGRGSGVVGGEVSLAATWRNAMMFGDVRDDNLPHQPLEQEIFCLTTMLSSIRELLCFETHRIS